MKITRLYLKSGTMGRMKAFVWAGMTVGSFVGGYIPSLWGADMFSISSLLLGAVGAIIGIWVGYRLGKF
jgi:uncharacterized membrane protein YeaQ/YmgE (transglycosylase-associated protein family)